MPETLPSRNFVSLRAGLDPSLERLGIAPKAFNTKLRIVLGWPIRWDIKLSTIKEARPAPAISTWIYGGVRLATSSASAVEIVRRKGMGIIISPSDRQTFLEQLNAAVKLAQERL